MNELLHPLHARQVVDELERRIVRAASAETGHEDTRQKTAKTTETSEPPD